MENQRIPETVHESWHPHVQYLFNDAKMQRLKSYILLKKPFYPIASHIFRVFSMPIDEIKVVVLSQDPYYNGQAIGLAFAVNHTTEMPPSLRAISKEIDRERDTLNLPMDENEHLPGWRELRHWRQQGVFLLNAALTVERGIPNSHSEYWSWFTKEIVHIIATNVKPVWLLWGREAQRFENYITDERYYSDFQRHVKHEGKVGYEETNKMYNWIIRAAHPAAGLREGESLFIGCNNFHYCNQILKAKGYEPINW